MPLASRLAALFGSPWQPAQSPLNSFIPAIKFSSVGAIGFARCGAPRAAESARRAKAFSKALGAAFAFVGNHPSHAAANAPAGMVKIPATNPRKNLRISAPALTLSWEVPAAAREKVFGYSGWTKTRCCCPLPHIVFQSHE